MAAHAMDDSPAQEETLARHGMIDLEEDDQLTPLMLCAQNGDVKHLQVLLASQPETVNAASPKYKVPKHMLIFICPTIVVYKSKNISSR
jgi:hypothetical protein